MAAEVARRRGGNGCKDADAVAEAVARRRTARRMKALDVRGPERGGAGLSRATVMEAARRWQDGRQCRQIAAVGAWRR